MKTDFPTASAGTSHAPSAAVEKSHSASHTEIRTLPRNEKFGITEIIPTHDFDVRHDQLIPGRPVMLEHYASIERHRASVDASAGGTVKLSDGHRVEEELLLWGTGYSVDLSYFASPQILSIRTLDALAARCGCIFRSLDAANLYFPGVGLDGIG